MSTIYLDYNATTPCEEAVVAEMLPFFKEKFGNPSSSYPLGREAKAAVEKARERVATLIGAQPSEIVFTASGSEANNTVLRYVLEAAGANKHIVTSVVEHPSIMEPLAYLQKHGFEVSFVPVDCTGAVDLKAFYAAVRSGTCFVTIMHSNNEVGTLQPVAEIGAFCREKGIIFHTDASQSLGKVGVDVNQLSVDFLTIAGHKLYAPKGIGALYVRGGRNINPLILGAKQERGLRAGTENVPYIAGLGKAAELSAEFLKHNGLFAVKEHFYNSLTAAFGAKIRLNGTLKNSLPNTLNVSFLGTTGNEVLALCDGISASTGSACHSGSVTASAVLLAMGISEHDAVGAVRLSIGRHTSRQQVDEAVALLKSVLKGKI